MTTDQEDAKAALKAKRDAVECIDYDPVENSHRCNHYVSNGGCAREGYFMCVEWSRLNPMKFAELVKEEKKRKLEVQSGKSKKQEYLKLATPPPEEKPAKKQKVHQLRPTKTLLDKPSARRHILKDPNLLTVEAVDELAKIGYEITAKLPGGKEVTLVPSYTGGERAELSYQDARTLLMVLQVFPDATLASVKQPELVESAKEEMEEKS